MILQIGYDADNALLTAPDLLVTRGETVAIIGSKRRRQVHLAQDAQWRSARFRRRGAGWAPKSRSAILPRLMRRYTAGNSILEEILAVKHMPNSRARDWLGRFLFSGDDVFRPISSLSGGERGRVALAKLALQGRQSPAAGRADQSPGYRQPRKSCRRCWRRSTGRSSWSAMTVT